MDGDLHWIITGEGDPNRTRVSDLDANRSSHSMDSIKQKITMKGKGERLNVAIKGDVVQESAELYGDTKVGELLVKYTQLPAAHRKTIEDMIDFYYQQLDKSNSKE